MEEDQREQAADVDPLLIPQSDEEVTVFYETSTESLSFSGRRSGMKTAEDSENEVSGTIDENHAYGTVLLGNGAAKTPCCPISYRSPDPDKSVTPFAVILLAVLFGVYILNQADRLVLPVAIPSGLRCEGVKEDCKNLSDTWDVGHSVKGAQYSTADLASINGSNSSNDTDCIHFNDYEQGLLTGMSLACLLHQLHIGGAN